MRIEDRIAIDRRVFIGSNEFWDSEGFGLSQFPVFLTPSLTEDALAG